jgi:hypothetical protein
MIACCRLEGDPARRNTPGCTSSQRPSRTHRAIADLLYPHVRACSRVKSPSCGDAIRRTASSLSLAFTSQRKQTHESLAVTVITLEPDSEQERSEPLAGSRPDPRARTRSKPDPRRAGNSGRVTARSPGPDAFKTGPQEDRELWPGHGPIPGPGRVQNRSGPASRADAERQSVALSSSTR